MNKILDKLNDKQIEAVKYTEGPLLILAGAGSGKTKTLVHRIAYLIHAKKVKPYNILAVTFTNKATGEMKERVLGLLGKKDTKKPSREVPFISTFHSFCVRVLRLEAGFIGYKRSFIIYDDYDSLSVIKDVMKELEIDPKQYNPRAVMAIISKAKSELVKPDTFEASAQTPIEKIVAKVYKLYQQRLKIINAFDFDDLIMKTVELWREHAEILKKYQERFKYILIDEYQDTNHAQFVLVKLLAKRYQNLCVIGDDWQSIYRFRGADYRNILEFEKDFPKAKTILLEQNYRSTKHIVEASNKIISGNINQKDKKLWTDKPSGEKIIVQEVFDEIEEGEVIIKKIFNLKTDNQDEFPEDDELTYEAENDEPGLGILDRILSKDIKSSSKRKAQSAKPSVIDLDFEEKIQSGEVNLNNYAILYRTNAQSRALEETFLRYGIPYQIIGGIRFYERKEIKDILAYLRILCSPEDSQSFKRIINAPPRGIGQKTWLQLNQYAKDSQLNIEQALKNAGQINGLTERARQALQSFATQLAGLKKDITKLKPSQIIDIVAGSTGYKEYILDGTPEGEARWENIQELKTVAKKYDNKLGTKGLEPFLEEVALIQDVDKYDEKKSVITLMTVHAAKGLEFPQVFLVGLEEGLFPHANSLFEPEEMEEERRLCYVGITRAKDELHITYACQRNLYGTTQLNSPSRFIEDLPDKAIERK